MTQRAPRAPVALFLTVLTLIGCSATGPAPARFEERQALPAPIEPRQIALTRLVSKLPVGTRIGRTSEGWLCLPQGPMTWRIGVDEDVPGEVIAAIKAVTLNVCSGPQGRSSEGSVEIEWQAYERRTRSVVLTSTTGGTAKSSRGGRDAYYDAAAAALRNLLAQEAFVKAVGSTGRAQLR